MSSKAILAGATPRWPLLLAIAFGLPATLCTGTVFVQAARGKLAAPPVKECPPAVAPQTEPIAAPPIAATTTEPIPEPEPPGPKAALSGDGTFLVGTDVAPGTYRGNFDSEQMCYWQRLRGLSGELADVIANEIESGPAVVTIKKTDKAFTTKKCGRWELIK